MENSNKSSDVCLFCCKTGKSISNFETSVVTKFVTFLERFSGDHHTPNQDVDKLLSKQMGCCKLCLVIVEGFCEEFHELKCLELRMEWKLERLMDIMKLAGRVPVRMLKLQQVFHQNNNYTDTENGKVVNTLNKFHSYRRKLIQKCDKGLSKSGPRIHLKRISHRSSFLDNDTLDDDHFAEKSETIHDTISKNKVDANKIKLETEKLLLTENTLSQNETVKVHQSLFNHLTLKLKCKVCCQIYPAKKLQAHMIKDHSLFPCGECGQSFQSEYFRDKHRMTHQDISTAKYKCIPCGRIFPKKSSLDSHNRNSCAHSKDRPNVSCKRCDEKFPSTAIMEWHMGKIHGVQPYQCSICKKNFKTNISLKYHHDTSHRDPTEFKYKCDLCDKRFLKDVILQVHMNCHHSNSEDLGKEKTAKKVTSVESEPVPKYFKCEKCPTKIFPTEKRLEAHKNSCHSIFPCPDCKQIFKNKYRRDKHAFAVHYKKSKNPMAELLAKLKILREKHGRRTRNIPGKRLSGSQIRNLFNPSAGQLQTASERKAESNYVSSDLFPDSVMENNIAEVGNGNVTEMRDLTQATSSPKGPGYKMKKIKLENQTILELEEEETRFLLEDLTSNQGKLEVSGDDVHESEAKLDMDYINLDQMEMSIKEPVDIEMTLED